MNNYDDIINLPHHKSKIHKPMSMENRAAQFSPFSALTGYEDAIKETGRITDIRKNIDDNIKVELDYKLSLLKNDIKNNPKASITYFIKDDKKIGGKYVTITGRITKIDLNKSIIIIDNIITHPNLENNYIYLFVYL